MIITVILNSSIEKTVEREADHRAQANQRAEVGGKEMNVAETMLRPDEEVLVFELSERNFAATSESPAALQDTLTALAAPDTVFVLTGKLSESVTPAVCSDIVSQLKEKGSIVIVDLDGPALREAVIALPNAIIVDRLALQELFATDHEPDGVEVLDFAARLQAGGIPWIAASLNTTGALFVSPEGYAFLPELAAELFAPGGAVTTALAYGLKRDCSPSEIVRLAERIFESGEAADLTTENVLSEVTEVEWKPL